MYERKTDRDVRCPLECGFEVFSGKWKIRIIGILGGKGTLRNSEIKRELEDITDAVLAVTLKELARDGLISRKQYNELPLKVEYSLTQKGEELIPILKELCRWSGRNYWGDEEKTMPQCRNCSSFFTKENSPS